MNLIGISGKKQSGKNLTADIIQYLTSNSSSKFTFEQYLTYRHYEGKYSSEWEVKSFARKLKEIVALLIGCRISDLENETFKNTPLGEEWDRVRVKYRYEGRGYEGIFNTEEEAIKWLIEEGCYGEEFFTHKSTPRMLLQTTGTEFGRNLVHPKIWINSLFSEFEYSTPCECEILKQQYSISHINCFYCSAKEGSKWIISDLRMKNEYEAVKKYGGITVRINNPRIISTDTHISETDLDDTEFDYYLENSGTIEELIEKVKIMLKHYEIKI